MFILSFGLILFVGFVIGYFLNKIHIPGLTGMIIVGLVFGPFCLNIIDPKILSISSELRQMALVIILTKSGLSINLNDLKKIGRPAILMCFVPATLEIVGVMLASHFILHLSWTEGLLLGSVLGAVSPAVVVPRMTKLIEEGYGKNNHAPEVVLAGASADDVYTIVLFYAFLGLVQSGTLDVKSIALIPVSMISGIALGVMMGFVLYFLFKYVKIHKTGKLLITFAVTLIMVGLESLLKDYFSISSLLGVMSVGLIIYFKDPETALNLRKGYSRLWTFFEVLLFVLVGASVDLSFAAQNILPGLAVLANGLVFRTIGVLICLIKTPFKRKERIFIIISYLPKATVQASIGGIALSLGLGCGAIILTVSVLAILITAPISAFFIDFFSKKLLQAPPEEINVQ